MTPRALKATALSESDRGKVAELYEQWKPIVYGIARRVLRDHGLAEDVTHDVFVKAIGRIDFSQPPGAITAWLKAVATSSAIDTRRRRALRMPMDLSSPVSAGSGSQGRRRGALLALPVARTFGGTREADPAFVAELRIDRRMAA